MQTIQETKKMLGISDGTGYSFIVLDDILFLKADNCYTEIHLTNGKKYTVVRLIKYFEEVLQSPWFIRIHQSYVVNMKHMSRYLNKDHQAVELNNGALIPVSRSRKKNFLASFIRA